jgi:hypothetical protein
MSRKKTKPVGQLLIACYLLPLVCALVFGGAIQNEKQKMGFLFSISAVSICSLVLYLTIKNWEHEWRLQAAQKREELPQKLPVVPAAPQVDGELIKQKDEMIERLQRDCELLVDEKKKMAQEQAETRLLLEKELKHSQEALEAMQNEVLERTLHAQMQQKQLEANEQQMAGLRTEITNLNFELKTVLKLEKKSLTT